MDPVSEVPVFNQVLRSQDVRISVGSFVLPVGYIYFQVNLDDLRRTVVSDIVHVARVSTDSHLVQGTSGSVENSTVRTSLTVIVVVVVLTTYAQTVGFRLEREGMGIISRT